MSTILDKTIDNPGLRFWRQKVGDDEANRIMQEGANAGSAMHGYIERYLESGEEIPDGSGKGYQLFEQYRKGFLTQNLIIPRLLEARVCHEVNGYRYAGTVDLVLDLQTHDDEKPVLTILDHKSISNTSQAKARMTKYGPQLAAYAKAIEAKHKVKFERGIVNFASTKKFRTIEVDLDEEWEKFYGCLEKFYKEELYKGIDE